MTTAHLKDQIRRSAAAIATIQSYVPTKPRGGVAWGKCPFHEERSASFQLNLAGHRFAGKWRCHGCGLHGDVFDFLMRIESVTLQQAVRRVAGDAGISLDHIAPESPAERAQRLAAEQERSVCLWWYRQKWKAFRGALDRELRGGPPEWGSDGFRRAEFCGQVMVWIERNCRGEKGMRTFRAIGSDRGYRAVPAAHLALQRIIQIAAERL